VRILGSRFLLVVAFGLLPMCLGGVSGCDSKPADGMLEEPPHVSAEQKAEVQAQYKKRMLERRSKSSAKKGKIAVNSYRSPND
jgi:hypothetical protein